MRKKLFALVIISGFGVVLLINALILSFHAYIVSPDSIVSRPVGLVFGGGMQAPGIMTAMQQDRVTEGVTLYQAGKVQKLMMTGDDGGNAADEVDAMKQYAESLGVPVNDIMVDPHGYHTYDSCYREHYVYGLTNVIAISQEFHLSRIIYLCRGFGIDTLGVTANLHSYGFESVYMSVREALARVKAFWQLQITRPARTLEK